jgi:RNA polymerase sigma factor (sigma-70 family)
MDSDQVLLDRWRAGDQRAGEELFQRYFADVLRFFDNKAWHKAEDLTQQTFLECVGSRDRFRGDSSFRTYLFAIAWNQLRHHYRSELKNERIDFDVSSINELLGATTSPSNKVDRAQQDDRVRRALRCLPLAQQTLLECHYWHELDAAALSDVFGVPAGTIRVRLLRARNALRSELARLEDSGQQADDADDPLTASLSHLRAEDHANDTGE